MVKISVIVPVYNCEDYIEDSISSVLNQTFKDIEMVCLDDGSSDNSLDILNELASKDSRLQVYSQENQGSSVARNNGLKKISGDYVYFFDADDYIVEDCFEKIYFNAKENDSDIAIFKHDNYRGNKFFKHSLPSVEKQFPDVDFNNFTFNCDDFRIFAFRGPYAPWFKLYKREFLEKYQFTFPANLNHNDGPFHVKTILKASRISFLPEYLYHYRMDNPNSISNSRLNRYMDIFNIIQIVEDFLKEEGLLEEFKKEFDYYKVKRITYEMTGRPNEYLSLAKEELSKVDLNNDYLTKNVLFQANSILNSNSIEEYNNLIEKNRLAKKNKNKNKDKEKNKNKDKKLSKDIKGLDGKDRKTNQDLRKSGKKGKEGLNSARSKIAKPLRKLKKLIK